MTDESYWHSKVAYEWSFTAGDEEDERERMRHVRIYDDYASGMRVMEICAKYDDMTLPKLRSIMKYAYSPVWRESRWWVGYYQKARWKFYLKREVETGRARWFPDWVKSTSAYNEHVTYVRPRFAAMVWERREKQWIATGRRLAIDAMVNSSRL